MIGVHLGNVVNSEDGRLIHESCMVMGCYARVLEGGTPGCLKDEQSGEKERE